jgi:F-type H+-transporting ATPase subunit delta
MTQTSSSALTAFGGVSRESSATARQLLDTIVKGLSVEQAIKLAGELFEAVSVLDSSTSLRRALTDGSREAADKAKLVSDLFSKSMSAAGLKLMSELVGLRWSSPSNLGDILEQLAVEAEASAANLANELDRLEEELFDFSRIIIADSDLRQALNSTKYSDEGKRVLVAKLFGGKISSSTNRVVGHLVSGLRGRNIERTIAFYAAATTARRERVIAHVQVAVALTDAQKEKLVKALTEKIGQPVRLNVEINPTVLGGLAIRFADELIDATIVNRLADAGRALAV